MERYKREVMRSNGRYEMMTVHDQLGEMCLCFDEHKGYFLTRPSMGHGACEMDARETMNFIRRNIATASQ